MSICVLVKVPEGLVLAADSATTVEGAPVTPDGKPAAPAGVLKVFFNATKLLQIRSLPVGVMTWGSGSFQARTIASLVDEFENTDEIRKLDREGLSVQKLAEDFWAFMVKKSDEFFGGVPVEGRPRSGIVLSGYSGSEPFPEEYAMVVPSEKPARIRPPRDGQPDFGANWYGLADAIVRLHHGRDDRLFEILRSVGVDAGTIEAVKTRLAQEIQYPVLFHAMPLGDAIDYAQFIVRTTIDRFRFVIGAELCGGPIDVAAITRKDGFAWVRSKKERQLR